VAAGLAAGYSQSLQKYAGQFQAELRLGDDWFAFAGDTIDRRASDNRILHAIRRRIVLSKSILFRLSPTHAMIPT
jgi:hypothetical protein